MVRLKHVNRNLAWSPYLNDYLEYMESPSLDDVTNYNWLDEVYQIKNPW